MKKILIVEDDEKMRKMLVDAFDSAGFETAQGENGQVGLQAAFNFKPDFILLDLMMPVMGGLEMFEKLRQESWGQNVPVTILTNSDESNNIAEALERGAFKYIIKSDISIEDIVKRVEKELVP